MTRNAWRFQSRIHDVDFITMFEQQYPDTPWSTIQEKMYTVMKEVFRAAVDGQPPAAIAPCGQSRAIYGLDLMLEWTPTTPSSSETTPTGSRTMEPQLLEVNYCPDCVRACKYHPQFFNHMFQTLFDLEGVVKDTPVTRLL